MVAGLGPVASIIADFRNFTNPVALPTAVGTGLSNRAGELQIAWDAYNGKLTDPLKTKIGQPNDNVKFNGCRVIVDKGVSFLFGRGVKFDLDGQDTRSDRETYLDAVWSFNQQDELLQKLAVNGGVCGHVFLKLYPTRPYPRLLAINPAMVAVEVAPDDATFVTKYMIYWSQKDPDGKQTDFRQVIARVPAVILSDGTGDITVPTHWTVIDQQAEHMFRFQAAVWKTINTEIWGWDFPPLIDAQNAINPNDYWGLPDLTPDIIHLNEAINRTLSNVNRILRLHAHPKTWSKGLSAEQARQLALDPSGMIHLPGTDSGLFNLEMQSDLASSISYYQRLREALYELSRVPEIASGKVQDLQYLSGVAMQVLYGPLIEKTEGKRLTYGGLFEETNRRLLVIAGFPTDQRTKINWPQVFPRDMLVESQTAQIQMQIGFSQDTLIKQLGGDPELERKRRAIQQKEELAHTTNMTAAQAPPPVKPQSEGQPNA